VTGAQSVVASGGSFVQPLNVAVAANGDLYVVDPQTFNATDGKVIRVKPVTGAQSLVASGINLVDPIGIGLDSSGQLNMADQGATGGSARS
jgi:hypothetical protein